MIRIVLLLAAVAAVAVGRRSPHADKVEQLMKSPDGARYSNNVEEDALLDVPGLIAKYGYPIEVHHVVTSDGYILEVHRIPYGRDRNNKPDPNKKVVFLMHGLVSSSAEYVVLGPGDALAYLLAEEGYDVWLGNARGNYYSRQHNTLSPDNRWNLDFWKFSWDEIGNVDLASMVDYVLEQTGQPKIHYVGHSQGGGAFVVLNSLRPEYNSKFISFQGLAPATFFTNNNNEIFHSLAPLERILETTAYALGIGELFGDDAFTEWFTSTYCEGDSSIFDQLCAALVLSGDTLDHYNTTMLPVFLGHAPAGSSVRQFAHFGQNIRYNTFSRFNYGTITNLLVYGTRDPPEYDLSKVVVPSYLHYGLSDQLVDYRDVKLLSERIGNLVGLYEAPRPTFNHVDFVWGTDVKEQVYDLLFDLLKDAERRDELSRMPYKLRRLSSLKAN